VRLSPPPPISRSVQPINISIFDIWKAKCFESYSLVILIPGVVLLGNFHHPFPTYTVFVCVCIHHTVTQGVCKVSKGKLGRKPLFFLIRFSRGALWDGEEFFFKFSFTILTLILLVWSGTHLGVGGLNLDIVVLVVPNVGWCDDGLEGVGVYKPDRGKVHTA